MKLDMASMLQQAQKVQSEMERIKAEINNKTVTAESGGGMVTVVMTGGHRVTSLKIAKELVNTEEIEMLEDLVLAAVNKASDSADNMAAEEMRQVSGLLPNIPGLNLGF